MKALFFALFMIATCSMSLAQLPGEYKALTITGGATMTGNDTSYLTGTIDGVGCATIQVNYTRSSGAVTKGSARLFTSNDGLKYVSYPSGRALVASDTLNITTGLSIHNLESNVASIAWEIPNNYARFYKIRVWTEGDCVGIISGSSILRRLNGYK